VINQKVATKSLLGKSGTYVSVLNYFAPGFMLALSGVVF
jgi:hypothetical protein